MSGKEDKETENWVKYKVQFIYKQKTQNREVRGIIFLQVFEAPLSSTERKRYATKETNL